MTVKTTLPLDCYRKYDLITEDDLNAVQERFDAFGVDEYFSWFFATDEEILDTVSKHQEEFGKINLYDEKFRGHSFT